MNGNFQQNEPQPAVELQNVGVLASGRWILHDINLSLPTGVCCAMVGPNGCGKSTLARVLAGFTWPTRGAVKVLGENFGETDLHELRKRIKLVQAANLVDFEPDMPARDVVVTGAFGTILLFDHPTDAHRARATELMAQLGVSHLTESKYATLSTGERMRVLIARALLMPPVLLLLDEPTAGLDLPGREMLLAGLDQIMTTSNPKPTILMISHHVEELPTATNWAVLMREGKISAAGRVDDVFSDEPMSRAFHRPVMVTRTAGRFTARLTVPRASRP